MTPTSAVTFEINVYPLVYKFLAHHYCVEPFALTTKGCRNRNVFAAFLYGQLERYNHFDTRIPRKYGKFTATLTLGVGSWVKQYGAGLKLTPAKVGAFNDFVRQRFFETMAQEVALRMAFGMGLRATINRFLERYGITEEELPIELAIRYYYRYRSELLIEYCPVSPAEAAVILPHERDQTDGQMESGWRAVA